MIHTLESWDTHWTHTSKAWDTVGYNNYKVWNTLYLQDWVQPPPKKSGAKFSEAPNAPNKTVQIDSRKRNVWIGRRPRTKCWPNLLKGGGQGCPPPSQPPVVPRSYKGPWAAGERSTPSSQTPRGGRGGGGGMTPRMVSLSAAGVSKWPIATSLPFPSLSLNEGPLFWSPVSPSVGGVALTKT